MAKTQWIILFVTFLISCASLALFIVSITTSDWLYSTARSGEANQDSEINYGLFSGLLTRYVVATPYKFELSITCDYGMAICMYSCQSTTEARHEELQRILKNETLQPCSPIKTMTSRTLVNSLKTVDKKMEQEYLKLFIASGHWVTTVMFLSFAIFFAGVSAIFSIINVTLNPIEPIFSILGLHIWNSVSAVSALLVLIIWGSLFNEILKFNIGITDTLQPETPFHSDGQASLGYSYYIILMPFFLNIINIGLLILRKYLLQKEAPASTMPIEKNDQAIAFY